MTLSNPASAPGQRGSATVVVLFIVFAVGLAAAGILTLVKREMNMNAAVTMRAQARAVANGGVERVIAWLVQNPTATVGVPAGTAAGTTANGSFQVVVNDKGDSMLELISTGSVNTTAVVSRAYLRRPSTSPRAASCAIFTQQNLTVKGSLTVVEDMWTNGVLTATGAASCTGVAFYVLGYSGGASGVTAQEAEAIDFPQIDSDFYYRIAVADGEVYNFNGSKYTYALGPNAGATKTNATFSPVHGVVWVNCSGGDNIKLNGSSGTLIVNHGTMVVKNAASIDATGNGSIAITPMSDAIGVWPSLILLDGSLNLTGNSGFTGCAYIRTGTTTLSGTTVFYGNIISYGSVTITGNAGVDPQGRTFSLTTVNANSFELLVWER